MGVTADDLHISEFKNCKLTSGVSISISNLIIKFKTAEVDLSDISPRTDNAAEEIVLSSGNYVAGVDSEADTYNIEFVEGKGNVSSSNIFNSGLNILLDDGSDGFSTPSFRNVDLNSDIELSVIGVTIKLTPSA